MDISITSFPLLRFDVTTDTIDVNRNKRGFIESVYRRYANASDARTTDASKKKRKEGKRRKGPNQARRRYDEIEETMKIVDRRENDRHGGLLFADISHYSLTSTYRYRGNRYDNVKGKLGERNFLSREWSRRFTNICKSGYRYPVYLKKAFRIKLASLIVGTSRETAFDRVLAATFLGE